MYLDNPSEVLMNLRSPCGPYISTVALFCGLKFWLIVHKSPGSPNTYNSSDKTDAAMNDMFSHHDSNHTWRLSFAIKFIGHSKVSA